MELSAVCLRRRQQRDQLPPTEITQDEQIRGNKRASEGLKIHKIFTSAAFPGTERTFEQDRDRLTSHQRGGLKLHTDPKKTARDVLTFHILNMFYVY